MIHYCKLALEKPHPFHSNRHPPHSETLCLAVDLTQLFRRVVVAGRAMACWRAADSDNNYIIKEQWRPCAQKPEGELLRRIASTFGVLPYVFHEGVAEGSEVVTTKDYARGSRKGTRHSRVEYEDESFDGISVWDKSEVRGKRKYTGLKVVKDRVLCRVVMAPEGQSITKLQSSKVTPRGDLRYDERSSFPCRVIPFSIYL
jgi:hypothetical protein